MECGKTLAESRGEMQCALENVQVACGIPTLMQDPFSENIASGIDEFMIRQPSASGAAIAAFPFSGAKESFFGDLHAQGRHAVEFFTQTKVVTERWPRKWAKSSVGWKPALPRNSFRQRSSMPYSSFGGGAAFPLGPSWASNRLPPEKKIYRKKMNSAPIVLSALIPHFFIISHGHSL